MSKKDQALEDPRGDVKRRRRWPYFLLFIFILAGASLYGGYVFLKQQFTQAGPLAEAVVFTVPKGSGLTTIAQKLEAEHLITRAEYFKLFVKLEDSETGLKAGEYIIPAQASVQDIHQIIVEGKALLYPFTAPEGLTSAQILRAMQGSGNLVADNPGVPSEGSLLPETYLTPRGMTQSELIEKMQVAQNNIIDEAWPNRAKNLPIKTKRDAIILASIVEKETGITSERDKVAGVFINRLNRGMRLESDPTIIYGITQGEPLGRGIRRSEIDRKTDWNTYQIDGLPKTPICNPGRDAILAVLNPAKTDAIFFVADGTGGHVFARTLSEHNRNVRNWRKIEKARRAGKGP